MTEHADGRDPVEELAEEFAARYRRGERPSLTEYVHRCPEHADEIRELFPALIVLEDARPGPTSFGVNSEVVPFQRLGEFRIIREIGRGGMGVVYEAEQESLGRRVALKVLPPGSLGNPRQVERFRREARAAARLHHTNLVPLFGVGEEGGTHYYVMQYIEGRPLDEVLDELRRLRDQGVSSTATSQVGANPDEAPAAGSRDSSVQSGNLSSAGVARSLWKGQFRLPTRQNPSESGSIETSARPDSGITSASASIAGAVAAGTMNQEAPVSSSDPHKPYSRSVAHLGIQVADALEYAVSQGVLHRDIKPSNLLLDMYGTVWLTDFGLAKASGTPDLTHTGDLFGTLRYMAPERFHGRSDVRSDVYALGLTLYELLALRPAFDDQAQAQLVRHITLDEPPRLDEVNPSLSRDLVTIVHKAIAKDAGDRYQTPGALAEDLRRFLEDRPILARRLSYMEQAWRWCRRNPAAAALVGLLLILAGLATYSGIRMQQEAEEKRLELVRRETQVRQAVEAALEQASSLRRKGLWAEAGVVLEQAMLRLEDARSIDLQERLDQAQADLELATNLENNRMDHRIGLLSQKTLQETVAENYAKAFEKAGLAVTQDGLEDTVAARIRLSEVCAPLVAALDDWALVTSDLKLRARLLRVARLADPDPAWCDRARNPAIWGNRQALEELARDMPKIDPPPQLLTTLGMLLKETGGDPEPLLLAAQQRRPADFWLNFELGMLLRAKRPAESLGFSRAALVARPENGVVNNLVGLSFLADYRTDEAIVAFRRAIELAPDLAAAHTNLGLILTAKGELNESLEACRRAVQLDPTGGVGYDNLGDVLAALGQHESAIAAYRKAVELDPKLAMAYNDLGNLYLKLERRNDARDCYRRALAVDPKLAAALYNVGNLAVNEGRIDEALADYRKAIDSDPDGPMAHKALGETLIRNKRFDEARTEMRHYLGMLFRSSPRASESRRHWERCGRLIAVDQRLEEILAEKTEPTDAQESKELAEYCLFFRQQYVLAVRFYTKAFSYDPRLANDMNVRDRYNAACACIMAANGEGTDAASLKPEERACLRRRGLNWLRDDLKAWSQALQASPLERGRVERELRHWQSDRDLAGIRDAEGLARLSSEDREVYKVFWNDVTALLAKAGSRDGHESVDLILIEREIKASPLEK